MSFFDQPHVVDPTKAAKGFEVIPIGTYDLIIENAEETPNKNKPGSRLVLTMQVASGSKTGSKIFGNITLTNNSTQAVEIGMKQLNALCILCGVTSISNASQLIGKKFTAKVKIKPAENGYPAKNEVEFALPTESMPGEPVLNSGLPGQQPSASGLNQSPHGNVPW